MGMPLRPDSVNLPMRKQRVTTPDRHPGFDALEDRCLLSVGSFGLPQGEEIIVVYAPSAGFAQRPVEIAPSGFPGESPTFGGLSGFPAEPPIFGGPSGFPGESSNFGGLAGSGGVGPVNHGWERAEFTPGSGPGWFTSDGVTAPGRDLLWTTTGTSVSQPAAGSQAPTNPPPGWDPEFGSDSSMTGGPTAVASNGAGYGNGPTTGFQPFVSTASPGNSSFFMKVSETTDPGPPTGFAQPPAPAIFTAERGRPDLNEPATSQPTAVGVLGGNNPGGLQVTVGGGMNSGSLGLGSLVVTVGNAPLQPNSLFSASTVNADISTSTSGVQDAMIGVGGSASVRISQSPWRLANPLPVYYSALRPASDSTQAASDGPLEPFPSPHGADLIVEALPMVRDSLEVALDQFVRRLDHLDAGLLDAQGPAPIVVFTLSLLSTAASAELARRYIRRKTSLKRGILTVDPSGRQLTLGFPELPGSWSERRP
jgi:hypothetical protein